LSPARFRSGAGWIELAGESHDDGQHASLRGRLDLAAATPFVRPWLRSVTGGLEVDLAADAHGGPDDLAVSGSVVVAAPVTVKLAALPIEASVPSGRLRVNNNVVETVGLPVAVRAERFPIAAVRKIDARARLSARVDGAGGAGKFGARVLLDTVDVEVPLAGRKPVRSAGGEIDVAGDARSGKPDVTRIDLPTAAE